MKNIIKILILLLVLIVLLIGFLFLPVFLNFHPTEQVKISKIKSSYAINEDVIIGGTAKDNSDIFIFFNKKVSRIKADGNGNWSVNLGKVPEGKYGFQALAKSLLKSDSVSSKEVIVVKEKPLSQRIREYLTADVSASLTTQGENPTSVSSNPPDALDGDWKLMEK